MFLERVHHRVTHVPSLDLGVQDSDSDGDGVCHCD